MLPFRKILFPVDFSERCRAMGPTVRQLSDHYQCPVVLLHVYEIPSLYYGDLGPLQPIVPSDLRAASESQLRQFALDVLPGLPHEQVVVEGEPSAEIHKYVKHQGTDLIVMPTSGSGPIRRLLLGSVVAKVLHDVSCPIWTSAHASSEESIQLFPFRSILCAVSLGDESESLIKVAARIATQHKAKLTLLHASGYPHPAVDVDYEFYRKKLIEASTQQLQSLRWENKIEAAIVVTEGSARSTIREQALQAKADLVIVGRGHAQGTFSRLWSDLYDVIRESPCPVLSI